MSSWKIQNKFVERVLKGDEVIFDFSLQEDVYVFGDSYHFYVVPIDEVYIDLVKISNLHNNLKRVKLLDGGGYGRMNFSANATVCNEIRETSTIGKRTTKNYIRKFEYLDKELWISENYLKEFEFDKHCEHFLVGADPVDGYKKPVRFDGVDFSVVILPVRVGGQIEIIKGRDKDSN